MVVVVVVVVLLLPVVLMVPLTAYKPAAATILRSRELCTRTKRSRTRHGRLDETSACVSANFRISSRIMLITRHGVATTSVLPRARCFDDRRRAASSVISSRRECKRERERERGGRERKNRAGMDGTRSAGGDTTTRATSSGRNRFIRHSTARRSALLSDETRSIHGTN